MPRNDLVNLTPEHSLAQRANLISALRDLKPKQIDALFKARLRHSPQYTNKLDEINYRMTTSNDNIIANCDNDNYEAYYDYRGYFTGKIYNIVRDYLEMQIVILPIVRMNSLDKMLKREGVRERRRYDNRIILTASTISEIKNEYPIFWDLFGMNGFTQTEAYFPGIYFIDIHKFCYAMQTDKYKFNLISKE